MTRLLNCLVMLSAAPLLAQTTHTVNLDGSAQFTDIQSAIDAAADGDLVLVAPGEYLITEPINFNRLHDPGDPDSAPRKNITLRSEAGAEVTTIRMSETPSDPARASVVMFVNGENAEAKLEGFTLTGGHGTHTLRRGGGGVSCTGSAAPMVSNCTIVGNRSSFTQGSGGGVACWDASAPTVRNCIIIGNIAFTQRADSGVAGGGFYCADDSAPLLINCVIAGNTAEYSGGGVACDDRSSPRFQNCTVADNFAWACPNGSGADVAFLALSAPRLTNCIVGPGKRWRCSGIWQRRSREALFVSEEAINGILFGEDGLLYACRGGGVRRFDASSGAFVDEFVSRDGSHDLLELAYGPDGNLHISTSGEGCAIRRHDGRTGAHLGDLVSCGLHGLSAVTGFVLRDRDGSSELLVSNGPGDNVLRYEATSGRFLGTFVPAGSGGLSFPRGLALGPDANLYVCSSNSSRILRYEGETGEFLGVFAETEAGCDRPCYPRDLVFDGIGDLYVVSANSNRIARYDGSTGTFIGAFAAYSRRLGAQDVIFGPDSHLYVAGDPGILRYDGFTGDPMRSLLVQDPMVTYSCIAGPDIWPGLGNIALDPLFIRQGWSDNETPDYPHDDTWALGDYHLQPGSPAIDAGTSEGVPHTDLDGRVRPCGAGVDMGAYEFGSCLPPRFLRGDCNDDGTVDISDAVFNLGFLFLGQEDPGCDDACDSNDDGTVDISDAIATLGVLFLGNGVIPVPGFAECGLDATDDEVGCVEYRGCP